MNKALQMVRVLLFPAAVFLAVQMSHGQQTIGKETLGIEYFQQGNFEKALPVFARLAQSYPDNAMYNYYYGVSLIKNNIFETAAKEALLNSVVDKTPVNANFYLGNYFHALEQWQEAKDFYDRYEKAGTKQEKKLLRLDYYVTLCNQKNNPFKPQKAADPTLFGDSLLKPPPKIDEKLFPVPEALKTAWFNFQVNEILAYHSIDDFRSEASKVLFTKAWMCTGLNDSLLALTDSLRKTHDQVARVDTRLGLVQQIVDGEQKSYQLMRDREKYLEQSRVKESAWWEREGQKAAEAYQATIREREERLNALKKKTETPVEVVQPAEIKSDTIPGQTPLPENVPEAIPARTGQTENLVFKVQVGAFRNGVLTPAFKEVYTRMSKLRKIDKITDPKKTVYYTVGNFTSYADASRMKDQLIREGMKKAEVVTLDNTLGRPVAARVPADTEKTTMPAAGEKQAAPAGESATQTMVDDELVFKVQIGSFKNGVLTASFKKNYDRIGKLQQIDKYRTSSNFEIYTVGHFLKYAEASALKDQMVREGIRDAFVAAFHRGARIPVNEAIKLAGRK